MQPTNTAQCTMEAGLMGLEAVPAKAQHPVCQVKHSPRVAAPWDHRQEEKEREGMKSGMYCSTVLMVDKVGSQNPFKTNFSQAQKILSLTSSFSCLCKLARVRGPALMVTLPTSTATTMSGRGIV